MCTKSQYNINSYIIIFFLWFMNLRLMGEKIYTLDKKSLAANQLTMDRSATEGHGTIPLPSEGFKWWHYKVAVEQIARASSNVEDIIIYISKICTYFLSL